MSPLTKGDVFVTHPREIPARFLLIIHRRVHPDLREARDRARKYRLSSPVRVDAIESSSPSSLDPFRLLSSRLRTEGCASRARNEIEIKFIPTRLLARG